jgi:hypothetical protein
MPGTEAPLSRHARMVRAAVRKALGRHRETFRKGGNTPFNGVLKGALRPPGRALTRLSHRGRGSMVPVL